MGKLIATAKKKPDWLENEGYWRILQVARIVATIPFAVISVVWVVVSFLAGYPDWAIYAVIWLACAVPAFWGVHLLAWLTCWIKAGFSDASK